MEERFVLTGDQIQQYFSTGQIFTYKVTQNNDNGIVAVYSNIKKETNKLGDMAYINAQFLMMDKDSMTVRILKADTAFGLDLNPRQSSGDCIKD